MLTLKAQGAKITKIVEDFSTEYGVSESALWKDWKKRRQWVRDVARLDDPSLIDEMLQGLLQILPNAWYEYKTNPNPSVKVAALKIARDTYLDIIEILQSLGMAVKVAEKMEIVAPWLNKFNLQPNISPTQGKKSSTKATPDSEH